MIAALQNLLTKQTEGQNSHQMRAQSALQMLVHVDHMHQSFLNNQEVDEHAILLDAFGLLQGLFVGVDALYDLAIGLTRYKYHVNVNLNKTLHELKYIRNDIVGHPTHRTYPEGGMGFSLLKDINQAGLTYETYVFYKNEVDIKERTISFKDLIKAFQTERQDILQSVLDYMKQVDYATDIPERIFVLFETLNRQLLTEIKHDFIKHYQLETNSNHRFIWRIQLLEVLLGWQEDDQDLNAVILYMSRLQASKMYEIALDLEKRKSRDLYVSLPKSINLFYRFIRKHEDIAYPLLENLHDYDHPLFQSDLKSLYDLNPSPLARKILDWLSANKDEKKIYLIGSVLRNYRKRK